MSARHSVAAAAMAVISASSLSAYAFVPGPSLRQYAHHAWTTSDSFAGGHSILAVAQDPDGYLLLATPAGIFRFDGVRTVLWQPLSDALPGQVADLLFSRDGTLWIATLAGLASWKEGQLTRYAELEGHQVRHLVEDHEGAIWTVGRAPVFDILCSVRGRRPQCHGTDGSLRRVFGLFVDSKGTLWSGADNGLWRWHARVPQFYPATSRGESRVYPLAEADDGTLLVGIGSGIARFVEGRMEMLPLPRTWPEFGALQALRDRSGGVWIATFATGLLYVRQGQVEWFSESNGLSRNSVVDLLEDREGNIWSVTGSGLDRFRVKAAATITESQGLPTHIVESILAEANGSVWIATRSGVARWRDGKLMMLGGQGVPLRLAQDANGRIWVSTRRGVGYFEEDRFVPLKAVPEGWIHAITADAAGDLWMVHRSVTDPQFGTGVGLVHVRNGSQVQQIPWGRVGHTDRPPHSVAADPQEGVWLGLVKGGILHFANGMVRAAYADTDGLAKGDVWDLRFDREGTLWVATGGGLSRLKNGRVVTLTSKTGLPCQSDVVHWTIDDHVGSIWMYLDCGIVRVARADIDAVFAGLEQNKNARQRLRTTLFDNAHGVWRSTDGLFAPRAALAPDGRLWFSPGDGVSVLDPRRIPVIAPPPPVHIERLTADDRSHGVINGLRLSPFVRDLQIEYTGLSLGVPEKMQFRYKLEGHDVEWKAVGTRRQAFYSHLAPGNYRFRVIASNADGVWNEAGAFVDFTVDPAYYQTSWFRLSMVVAFITLVSALHQIRARQLARQLNVRFEERLAERTRLARDIHDTLLQTVQGSKMVADSALKHSEDAARQRIALEQVARWLDRAVREGREALQSLRTSNEHIDLVETLQRTAQSLCEPMALPVTVSVSGSARPVSVSVRESVYRIGEEAVRNACAHASATSLEVELQFGRDLILSVRDNGKGIDVDAASRGREGHFGLQGMRERAARIDGSLTIQGGDTGTSVTLTIPGGVAYS